MHRNAGSSITSSARARTAGDTGERLDMVPAQFWVLRITPSCMVGKRNLLVLKPPHMFRHGCGYALTREPPQFQ